MYVAQRFARFMSILCRFFTLPASALLFNVCKRREVFQTFAVAKVQQKSDIHKFLS